jgi:indole-3-glycerol phosphate synthase
MSQRNFLEEILQRRRQAVARQRAAGDGEIKCTRAATPHRLRAALCAGGGTKIIAEFKRASPSLGDIRRDADPAQIARQYESAGACAISVLTEPDFFHGSLDDLRSVRTVTSLPILRKDFIVDSRQIGEAAAAGADAILLIVAALSDAELASLRATAEDELGLDALVEVHTEEEMGRAANAGAKLIGVNNRDLRTFVTSLEMSERLAPLAPNDATLVSESGLSSPADLARLTKSGYAGFLIGEKLMCADDPAAALRSFLGNV